MGKDKVASDSEMLEDGVVAQCGMRCRFDIPATSEHPPRVIPPKEQLQIEGQAPAVMVQTILALYMSHFVMLSVRMHSSHPAPSDFVALPLDCALSTSAIGSSVLLRYIDTSCLRHFSLAQEHLPLQTFRTPG